MNKPSAPSPTLYRLAFTREDFDYLRHFVAAATGIVAGDDKYTLYYSRLAARLRLLGLPDFRAYRDYLKQNPETESIELVNSLTTNLTSFFREPHHFDFIREQIVPARSHAGGKRLRIWSTGCSSGEEAYSIAITLLQSIIDVAHWEIEIVATDIDSHVLATAVEGSYPRERVAHVDAVLRERFFRRDPASDGARVSISEEPRRLIQFRHHNLLHPWPFHRPFDLIFCRNVVIYFSEDTKRWLVNRFAETLVEGGYLFMGHSESLYRTSDRFESCGNTVYRLQADARARAGAGGES